MKLIVAADREWGIGKENGLLFSLPEDMKFFRNTTSGKVVVMGRKTLESFPGGKPLKNRTNIVLTRGKDIEGAVTVNGIDGLMRVLEDFFADDVFICGGASVYAELLDYCTEALVTKVDAIGGADAFFPNLDERENWNLAEISEPVTTNGYTIRFCKYLNRNVLKY